jgi:hypothetical protein
VKQNARNKIFHYRDELVNPLTPELNPSTQRCLPRFFLGILIFKGLIERRIYKSFGVKGLRVLRAMAVYSENQKNYTNTVCGKLQFLSVTVRGAYCGHWAFSA